MDNHLFIKLIEKEARVILPDFGAFMIKQGPPRVIIFNEYLKFNDGLVVNFVMEHEGIDKETATANISEFVNKITERIIADKPYVFEDLGVLYKDPKGKIQFDQYKVDEPASESRKEAEAIAETTPVTGTSVPEDVVSADTDVGQTEEKAHEQKADREPETVQHETKSTIKKRKVKEPPQQEDEQKEKEQEDDVSVPEPESVQETEQVSETAFELEQEPLTAQGPESVAIPDTLQDTIPVTEPVHEPEPGPDSEEPRTDETVPEPESTGEKEVPDPVSQEDDQLQAEPETKVNDEDIYPENNIWDEPGKTADEKTKKKKSLVWLWIVIGIGVPVIGVAVFAYLNMNMVKGWLGMSDGKDLLKNGISLIDDAKSGKDVRKKTGKTKHDKPVAPVDSLKKDSAVMSETDTLTKSTAKKDTDLKKTGEEKIKDAPAGKKDSAKEKPKEQPVIVQPTEEKKTTTASVPSGSGPYHVVVGCFEERNSADIYTRRMKDAGFTNTCVWGRIGKFNAVVIGSYGSRSEASAAKKDFDAAIDPDSWVYKK